MIENPISRFSQKYRGHLLHLVAEEYLAFVCRHLPGIEGIILRRLLYGKLFKRLGMKSLIYSGVFLTHTYGIEVGDYFSINSGALIDGRGGIKIGSGVMIGPHTVIVSSSHQTNDFRKPMTSLDHIMEPVTISDDVWIGANAFIRGGVEIGRGAIIGAGSVVLRNVPEFMVAAGNPAKIVKDRRMASSPGRN